MKVSRQIIVGDVALLRAAGHDITATARGYILTPMLWGTNPYTGKIACLHGPEDIGAELHAMVGMGALVVNVIIDHELYGEIIGYLNLKTPGEVDDFITKMETSQVKPLSDLTQGAHLHTIACHDKGHFEQIQRHLNDLGFQYDN